MLKLINTSDIPNYKGNLVMYIVKKVIKFLIIMALMVGVLGVAYCQYREKQSKKPKPAGGLYEHEEAAKPIVKLDDTF